MEMGLELEDDVFFADLSKRIALLIMEEEEEHGGGAAGSGGAVGEDLFWRRRRDFASFQAFAAVAPPPLFQQQTERPRGIKGTGVFIPQSLLPNKRNGAAKPVLADKPKPGGAAGKPFHHHRRQPPRHLRW